MIGTKHIAQLHHITQDGLKYAHVDQAERACQAGVTWVQFRTKIGSKQQQHEEAEKVQHICQQYGATFIINDNVALAQKLDADGVHLGKQDMDPEEARTILGDKKIIGGTANTMQDIEELAAKKVDYIGLGPYKFTATKEKLSPVLGLNGYNEIDKNTRIKGIKTPKIAIGGILPEDVKKIMQSGMYGIAVASAINEAEDIESAIDHYLKEIEDAALKNS